MLDGRCGDNTNLSSFVHWTLISTLLVAFLGLALFGVDNGDSTSGLSTVVDVLVPTVLHLIEITILHNPGINGQLGITVR